MEAIPNWSKDYKKLAWLIEERFAIQAFHPNGGHILIGDTYCFHQSSFGIGFSIVSFHVTPMHFHTSEDVIVYCEVEKIEFIDPFNAYTVGELE